MRRNIHLYTIIQLDKYVLYSTINDIELEIDKSIMYYTKKVLIIFHFVWLITTYNYITGYN